MEWLTKRLQVFREAIGTEWLLLKLIALPAILAFFAYADGLYAQLNNSSAGESDMIFGFPTWILGIIIVLGFLFYWLLEYAVALTTTKIDVRFQCKSLVTDEMLKGNLDGPRPNNLYLVIKNASHRKIDDLMVRLTRITLERKGFQTPDLPLVFPNHNNKNRISINPNDEERAFLGSYAYNEGQGEYSLRDLHHSNCASLVFLIQISAGTFPAFTKEFLLEQKANGFSVREIEK